MPNGHDRKSGRGRVFGAAKAIAEPAEEKFVAASGNSDEADRNTGHHHAAAGRTPRDQNAVG